MLGQPLGAINPIKIYSVVPEVRASRLFLAAAMAVLVRPTLGDWRSYLVSDVAEWVVA